MHKTYADFKKIMYSATQSNSKAKCTSPRLPEKRHWKSQVRTPIRRLNSNRKTEPVLSLLTASVRSSVYRTRRTDTPGGCTLVIVRRTLPDVMSHITIWPWMCPTNSRVQSAFRLNTTSMKQSTNSETSQAKQAGKKNKIIHHIYRQKYWYLHKVNVYKWNNIHQQISKNICYQYTVSTASKGRVHLLCGVEQSSWCHINQVSNNIQYVYLQLLPERCYSTIFSTNTSSSTKAPAQRLLRIKHKNYTARSSNSE